MDDFGVPLFQESSPWMTLLRLNKDRLDGRQSKTSASRKTATAWALEHTTTPYTLNVNHWKSHQLWLECKHYKALVQTAPRTFPIFVWVGVPP